MLGGPPVNGGGGGDGAGIAVLGMIFDSLAAFGGAALFARAQEKAGKAHARAVERAAVAGSQAQVAAAQEIRAALVQLAPPVLGAIALFALVRVLGK